MINIENYSLDLKGFRLKNINLSINKGEIFAIVGETGAGKTILLESIAGFYSPDGGTISYSGRPVWDTPLEKRRIGFVYQDYSLFPHMKVRANIEFGLKMHKVPKKERRAAAEKIMSMLKIEHLGCRYPITLSGGEKQRAALARALVLKPQVLFMDEPFSALDPNTKQRMYELIRSIHKNFECTIIFVTHDFYEAASLADRIGVMIKGGLREVFGKERLFDKHDDPEVAEFLGRYEAKEINYENRYKNAFCRERVFAGQ